jgi:putative cardiolipin synthase
MPNPISLIERQRYGGQGRGEPSRMLALFAAAWVSLFAGCASLPSLEGRTPSSALAGTDQTPLGQRVAPLAAKHSGQAGIHPMPLPADAFAARVLLANVADKSIDAQYYLWHGDQTGYLLYEAVWQAAERGVRVRLLLDDINTAGLDETIAVLDAHPNIEVRLYNPIVLRHARGLNFITDFARLNRRMHNKSFTVDNQVAIVGGRNIANEYLGAGDEIAFADLDVIAIGPVVRDVSKAFDLYWNSASAYPAGGIVAAPAAEASERLKARFAEARADPDSRIYLDAVRDTPLLRQLLASEVPFEWTTAVVVRDEPAKTLDTTGRTDLLLLTALLATMGSVESSFDLISPYFVPGDQGTAALVALARRGVKVRVLTNSLSATDVGAVHAGYAKRRVELLGAGVTLYELKRTAAKDDPAAKRRFGISSTSSLHAKTFAADGKRIFVGSFNFDQRSALLNTEMGLVIDSPVLARRLGAEFDTTIPQLAYEVRLTSGGRLEWIDRVGSVTTRYETEPQTSGTQRAWVEFLSVLPIEWLL